ncbi:MAG: hypothetical protein EHM36_02850, partial [Deltaproteobacteria bacterium]
AVLSAARDGTVKAWEIATGREVRSFRGHPTFIRSARFNADGRYVLLAGLDSRVKICEVATGKEVRTLKGHSGPVNSVAFSPDGKYALSGGSDRTVRLWETSTGRELKAFKGHLDAVNSTVFTPDGKRAISGGDDGALRIWDVSAGREMIQLNSFVNEEWIATAPEGYFNASPNGARLGIARAGNRVLSLENFYESFFNPGKVARLLTGQITNGQDIRKGFGRPPDVRIIDPKKGATLKEETASITVEARDRGGGIEGIRLYHNGTGVESVKNGALLSTEEGGVRKSYGIALVPGNNVFKATAFSKDGTESDPHEVDVRYTGGRIDAHLHLVAVGINRYRDNGSPLDFAVPGAKGVKGFFEKKWKNASSLTHLFLGPQAEIRAVGGETTGVPLFAGFHFVERYDEDATREGIKGALSGLKAKPQDVVLIYFAGRSRSSENEWHFLPYDAADFPISSSEISGMLRAIPALRKVIFFDSYLSGATPPLGNVEDQRPMALIARSTGAHVISASTGQREALKFTKLEQSPFVQALLRGLNGEAESFFHIQVARTGSSARDKIVSIKSLAAYMEKSLPELCRRYGMEAISPVIYSQGPDFPLAINRWNE